MPTYLEENKKAAEQNSARRISKHVCISYRSTDRANSKTFEEHWKLLEKKIEGYRDSLVQLGAISNCVQFTIIVAGSDCAPDLTLERNFLEWVELLNAVIDIDIYQSV
mgnify:CR=1 FL=1